MTKESSPPSEARQNFELVYQRALEIFTVGDRKVMVDWLEQGDPNFSLEARVLMTGLSEHEEDFSQPIPKDLVLIAANLLSRGEGIGKPEIRRGVRGLLIQKIGEGELKRICFEGFEEKPKWLGQGYNFTNREAVKTDLADKVDKAVTEFLAERKIPEAVEAVPAGLEWGDEQRAAAASAPAEPEWGDEQRVVAEKFYNETLKDDGRTKVDALVKALIASGQSVELITELMGGLPSAKRDWDIAKGVAADFDWIAAELLGGILTPSVKENLKAVMMIKEVPKGKDRSQVIVGNLEFYNQLAPAIRWRIERLGEEKSVRERIIGQANKLNFRPGENDQDVVIKVDQGIQKLIEEAKQLEIILPARPDLSADGVEVGSAQVGKISVNLTSDWHLNQTKFEYKPFASRTKDMLAATEALYGSKFENGYSLINDGQDFVLQHGGEFVARIVPDAGGLIVLNFQEISLEGGLEATFALGQALNHFFANDERFPALILELKEPEAAEAETSSSEPEVPEEAAAEAEDFWQLLGRPAKPAEPPADEAGGAEGKAELPDWLKP